MVRHGQTTGNVAGLIYGQVDYPLTQMGRDQAAAIRPILETIKFDKVYSSDLSRAIETQEIALPGVKANAASPLIREYDVGSIVGQPLGTAKTLTPEGGRDYTPFDGETSEQVQARLKKFLETYLESDPCETAAVFAHNGIMIAMMNLVLGQKLRSPAIQSKNCAVHVFEFKDGKWSLLAWNYGVQI